jgi:hypothetical protein
VRLIIWFSSYKLLFKLLASLVRLSSLSEESLQKLLNEIDIEENRSHSKLTAVSTILFISLVTEKQRTADVSSRSANGTNFRRRNFM